MRKVLRILFLFLIIISISGCNKRNINMDKFTKIMKKNGYSVSNITDKYKSISQLKEAATSINESEKWQIDFYILDSNESAEKIYNNNVDTFKYLKNDDDKETIKTDKNFSRYSLISDNSYGVVAIIDNTMVYVSASNSSKDKVDNILKEIGY